jgi:hypothetical protein
MCPGYTKAVGEEVRVYGFLGVEENYNYGIGLWFLECVWAKDL